MNLFSKLESYSENPAIFFENDTVTYRVLLELADEIGRYIKSRSVLFVLCKNSLESVIGYLGFLRAGAVPLLLGDSVDPANFKILLEAYRPQFLFLPTRSALDIQGTALHSTGNYTLIQTQFEAYPLHPDLALLLSTSGSTGSPKLVRQSKKNLQSNSENIIRTLGITQSDRAMTTMPMNYTYGLSILNTHLAQGASVILTDKTLMDRAFWEILKERKATTFGGVPYIYEMLKKLRFEKMELPSLKYITQAGGKLRLELCLEFARICSAKGIQFQVMYGQTEATARMSHLPSEYAISKAGSIGVPIPGGQFWIEDEHRQIISESDIAGELIYRGENVSMGYAESFVDLIKGDENGGILHTGDVAKRDADGFYYIVGRKKRFLKMFGVRVNLEEIEQLLQAEGFDCACAGVDDNLKIYITDLHEKDRLKVRLSERTGIHPIAFKFVVVDKLPRNDVGKVLYSILEG